MKIGKAIGDFNLIEEGDKILVAVSGGKDSLTMLDLLRKRQRWSPVKYDLVAGHIKADFKCGSCIHEDVLEDIFKKAGVEQRFGSIKVLDEHGKTSCFWCSWNRRKELFKMADAAGCNKVAFGHHKDDIIETTLLNLFFQGEFASMMPRQELFAGRIVIIRPLCYVEENVIGRYSRENAFPEQKCGCPFSSDGNRKYIKGLIKELQKRSPGIKTNLFKSAERIKHEYLYAAKRQEELVSDAQ